MPAVHEYFRGKNAQPATDTSETSPPFPVWPRSAEVDILDDPFTEQEVEAALRGLPNNSAPGPDRLRYSDWKRLGSSVSILTTIINTCRVNKKIPLSWKVSSTILIHKAGDIINLDNWRPIALQISWQLSGKDPTSGPSAVLWTDGGEEETDSLEDIPVWRDNEEGSLEAEVKTGDQLSGQQRQELHVLLGKFCTLFSNRPGRTSLMEHDLQTGTARPVKLAPYRIPQAYRETVKQEIRDMLQAGIIEPSNSEWGAPLVLAKKKDGSLRLCVDFRRLNSVSKSDAYPMPRIDDLIDLLGKAKYILNAIKRLMDGVIRGFDDLCAAYLDDIIIFSSSWEEHLKHLSIVNLQTDALERGFGAVLSQRSAEQGEEHPIAFFSRKLLPREEKYSTIEKECLAIKLAMHAFRTYLVGRHFTVETDHRSLVWLDKLKDSNSRLTRWSLALQPYNFTVVHRSGSANGNADGLSRTPWPDSSANEFAVGAGG
ncbi:hypothetical protein EMCRGX_G005471 [Ephydatia muelleri]